MMTNATLPRLLAAPLAALALSAAAAGQTYETSVVASDLASPTGIDVHGFNSVFFTEVPTPGVPGSQGGQNGVNQLLLNTGEILNFNMGEPEPVNIAVSQGQLYWTCKSAGVILRRDRLGQISMLLTGLDQPSGIDVDAEGNVFFTSIPTPGVPGSAGGTNTVSMFNGTSVKTLSMGEPEPADITLGPDGSLYWTCKSAGVILERTPDGDIAPLLTGLNEPLGIDVDQNGEYLYFTEVPTPGVPGSMGGGNFVWRVDLKTLARSIVDLGDPQPTDVAVATNGNVYWTCTSAGVIVEAVPK